LLFAIINAMNTEKYNFEAFVQSLLSSDLSDIHIKVFTAISAADKDRQRATNGGAGFSIRAKDLSSFLETGIIPQAAFFMDIRLYRMLAESLVQKGQMSEEILDGFKGRP
jgi:hypothetical protein